MAGYQNLKCKKEQWNFRFLRSAIFEPVDLGKICITP